MKTKLVTLSAIAGIVLLVAFKNKETKSPAPLITTAAKEETFKMDTKASTVDWTAEKVTGKHNGTVPFSTGEIKVAKDMLSGGSFDVDMTGIKVTDLEGEWATKLEGHLKADDFFGVDKNPKAKFVITSVVPLKGDVQNNVTITGKLTIKEITNEITFPANTKVINGTFVGFADMKVDRTKYGIKYGSKSFFEDIGDKAIYDEFTLKLKIVANK
jgi:polyisoprenoid-binding protein YceI